MKRLMVPLLALCGSLTAFGQYVYDSVAGAGTWSWATNGTVTTGPPANFSSNGSIISNTAVSGTATDYEAASTLTLASGGGTYIHFLRTSSNAVVAGSGSYLSAEIVVPSGFTSPGAATLNINQCTSGSITLLASTSITAMNGMTFRTILWGGNLWVFVNGTRVLVQSVSASGGNAGYGGSGMPSGSGFSSFKLGHHDTVAPAQVISGSIASSVFPTNASLQWQGVLDDAIGAGLYQYAIARNGTPIANTANAEFADATVAASTTYTYTIQALDYHGNLGTATTMTVNTPAAGAVDPRRVGIYSTGSYWGGGGEQIDTRSGNLNFSIPLASAQGRTGWSVPVGLVYDSQNWRQDSGVNWKLGADVGYGFGWKMLIGSVTPYYSSFSGGVDHYVYMDGTGAQYRLDQNTSGIWTSSLQSVYVWLDTTVSPNKLHFRDGKFQVLGCTSGGDEPDAGTLYPTIIEDSIGNQVIVTYDTGVGLPFSQTSNPTYGYVWTVTQNTSSRIIGIEDSRAHSCIPNQLVSFSSGFTTLPLPCALNAAGSTMTYETFGFGYDRATYGSTPHLVSYSNLIGVAGIGTFSYVTATQEPPFGVDARFGLSTAFLSNATIGYGMGSYQFGYDAAGAGELISMIFPFGGELSWNHSTFIYSGNRSLREVSGRSLAADSAHSTTPWSYGISRPDASNSVTLHTAMSLTDASGVGAKTWKFATTGSAWQLGLASEFIQSASPGGTVLQDDTYTWSQDPAGHPYISAKLTATGQGTSNPTTAYSTQTIDSHGNLTQAVVYPLNNTTTPLQTYNNTYVTTAGYLSNYLFSLVSNTTLTTGGSTITLATNTYDYCGTLGCYAPPPSGSPAPREYDSTPPVPYANRGLPFSTTTTSKTSYRVYFPWGMAYNTWDTAGTNVVTSADSGTNYAAPVTINAQSYNETVGYTSFLGVASTTGANGESLAMGYDGNGRPITGTSAYGAVTNIAYTTAAPFQVTETGPQGFTRTTLDGVGRTIKVERGTDATHLQSVVDTVYAPCACSPLGKLQKTSQPYAAGGSAAAWTTYAYDGLGRTLSVQLPDGASTTHYAYAGSQTTVTDPAGKGKQFSNDALGNLVTVVEPDPCVTTNTLTTTYTYDWMKHVAGVSMPRANTSYSTGGVCNESGATTQTRTFVYNNAGLLVSATNPENGTITYAYSSDDTLLRKRDAKGQSTGYTYDSLKRVTTVRRFINDYAYSLGSDDPCQRVTYTYDTNPVNPSFSSYSYGRLTTAQYGCPVAEIVSGSTWGTASPATYIDMYSYHRAGGVTAKQVVYYGNYTDSSGLLETASGTLEADYTFDTAGRLATLVNPATPLQYVSGYDWAGNPLYTPCALTYAYDSMGRPSSVANSPGSAYPCGATWTGASYDFAGRLTAMGNLQPSVYFGYTTGSMYVSESRAYNVNGQLSTMNGIQYVYSATQNNGQIIQAVDGLSGETITYQYDALKRLTSAASVPTAGSAPAAWTEGFQYDGFGNMTAQVWNGTTYPISITSATNQLTYGYYDGNGNATSGPSGTLTYDVANRMMTAAAISGGIESFQYAPDNKRVLRTLPTTLQEYTFYGGQGEKLGVFWVAPPASTSSNFTFAPRGMTLWFGGRIVEDFSNGTFYWLNQTAPMVQDRLGTNRTNGARYLPYGGEITSTANDQVKFGTYTRDSYTGLDYADQRFYASTYGRFNTPDPYQSGSGSGTPGDPGSWNRYAYVEGDPINFVDRHGLFAEAPDDPDPGVPGPGPQRPVKASPADPTSIAPPCNPTGNGLIETKLNFIQNNFADALNAANNFEQGAPGSKVNATALATMFLQWSIGEAGYPGQSAQVTAENNSFGFQNAGVGGWGGLEIACPQSSAIPGNSTNACFSAGTSWGQELGAALSTVSSKTGVTYGQALENALGGGAGTTAAALQAIANNGWNGSSTYGANKTTQISIQSQVDCLIKNGYVP